MATLAAGNPALTEALCRMQQAEPGCSSQTSSGSGWSTGTNAQAAVDQQQASSPRAHYALQPQGDCSLKPAPAQQAAPAAAARQQAAAAAPQHAWQTCLQPPAGCLQSLDTQASDTIAWQRSSSGLSSGTVVEAQQPPQQSAAPPATPAELDPWSCGLDLVACGAADLADVPAPPLPITDASLEALLAPFEEWPFMLQPAGSASPAAALMDGPAEAPAPYVAASPAHAPPAQAAGATAGMPQPAADPRGNSATASPAAGAAAAAAEAKPPPRRKGGRPRVHHPRTAAAAGGASAPGTPAAAALAPAGQPFKKKGRGPKPKYVFTTEEEAADARRERNRKAALDSYYRKKEHTQRLQAEVAQLQAQNAALEALLTEMTTTGLCPLLEASNEGINMWLKHTQAPAVAASH